MTSVALLEVGNLSPTFAVAERCAKSAGVRILGIENADSGELCIKLIGSASAIAEAVREGEAKARQMHATFRASILNAPESEAMPIIDGKPAFSDLLSTYDTYKPRENEAMSAKEAIGLLETQGLSANLHALDVMLKTAAVTVAGKEKIGGGYVTIMVRGDIAAVQAAIEAGRSTVEKLGAKLILADLISNPHPDLLALLPK